MVGGATYEESMCVAMMNEELKDRGVRILLGATTIHNSQRCCKYVNLFCSVAFDMNSLLCLTIHWFLQFLGGSDA